MAKLHFVESQQSQRKGTIVASLFKVDKVNGFSLKFKSKIRDTKGDLVDMTGKKLIDILYGDSMLCIPNSRMREGKRDPQYIVYAYPEEQSTPKKA